MNAPHNHVAMHAAAAAICSFMASAAFALVALQTHRSLTALGPICGLSRPAAFFLHCPACPAALGFALLGAALASSSIICTRTIRIPI